MRSLFLLAAMLGYAQDDSLKQILDAHNAARDRVGVPHLEWSAAIAETAQKWADSLVAQGKLAHRPQSNYGENLFQIMGAKATPGQVIATWTDEATNYDHATNACKPGAVCGHYTQVIWKTTTKVGCGTAHDAKQEVWVCNYDPAGNWQGESPY